MNIKLCLIIKVFLSYYFSSFALCKEFRKCYIENNNLYYLGTVSGKFSITTELNESLTFYFNNNFSNLESFYQSGTIYKKLSTPSLNSVFKIMNDETIRFNTSVGDYCKNNHNYYWEITLRCSEKGKENEMELGKIDFNINQCRNKLEIFTKNACVKKDYYTVSAFIDEQPFWMKIVLIVTINIMNFFILFPMINQIASVIIMAIFFFIGLLLTIVQGCFDFNSITLIKVLIGFGFGYGLGLGSIIARFSVVIDGLSSLCFGIVLSLIIFDFYSCWLGWYLNIDFIVITCVITLFSLIYFLCKTDNWLYQKHFVIVGAFICIRSFSIFFNFFPNEAKMLDLANDRERFLEMYSFWRMLIYCGSWGFASLLLCVIFTRDSLEKKLLQKEE